MDEKSRAHETMTFGKYASAYVALLLLSGLTFGLSFTHLGAAEWLVALGIATVKSIIVAWYFMHLVEMSSTHRLAGVVAACLLATLILFAMADVWTRPEVAKQNAPSIVVGDERKSQIEPPSQGDDRIPSSLRDVGVDEHLGDALPLRLQFSNETGGAVRLSDVFDGNTPTILTLNYSNCPMLCSLQLSALATTIKQLELSLGRNYRVITVSLDPDEKPETARQSQARYLQQAGYVGVTGGWRFLTGAEPNIRALARAIGFRYSYDAQQRQYNHAAAIAIASPTGRISRYLYGIEYDPKTVKLALIEASDGHVGSTVDKLILFCSVYNPRAGGYGLVASRMVTIGGALTLAVLAVFLVTLWRRDATRVVQSNHS